MHLRSVHILAIGAVGLASCGGQTGVSAPGSRRKSEAESEPARVLAVRPMEASALEPALGGFSVPMLLGESGETAMAPPGKIEVILKTREGRVLSFVQPGDAGWRVGDSALVAPARPGSQPSPNDRMIHASGNSASDGPCSEPALLQCSEPALRCQRQGCGGGVDRLRPRAHERPCAS